MLANKPVYGAVEKIFPGVGRIWKEGNKWFWETIYETSGGPMPDRTQAQTKLETHWMTESKKASSLYYDEGRDGYKRSGVRTIKEKRIPPEKLKSKFMLTNRSMPDEKLLTDQDIMWRAQFQLSRRAWKIT